MKYLKLFENFQIKKILFLVEDGFNYQEYLETIRALSIMGHECVISSPKEIYTQVKSSSNEIKILVEIPVKEVEVSNFDLLIIPGGSSPSRLKQNKEVLDLVREFNKQQKPIAAICHGPEVLAESGILKATKVTGNPEIEDLLNKSGGSFENKKVVNDYGIITSRNPEDLPYFIEEIQKTLS